MWKEIVMRKNKVVIAVFLILILSVLVVGKGVNNPITVNNEEPMFEYIEGDMAYDSLKSEMKKESKDFVVKVKELPSGSESDYEILMISPDLDINTWNKVTIYQNLVSISGENEDRIMMVPSGDGKAVADRQRISSCSFFECNYVIYTGGLSKEGIKELRNDLGMKLIYKVGMYKEKELVLTPEEYGISVMEQDEIE